jgi:hypothetical protein
MSKQENPLGKAMVSALRQEVPEDARRQNNLPEGITYGDAVTWMLSMAAVRGDHEALRLVRTLAGMLRGETAAEKFLDLARQVEAHTKPPA